MRPGILFLVIFIWFVCIGGRFVALFLQEVAQFNETTIGITFGLQIFFGSIFAGYGSIQADRLELLYPRKGRIYCLIAAVIVGTIGTQLHFVIYYFYGDQIKNEELNDDDISDINEQVQEKQVIDAAIIFHIITRIIISIFLSIMSPILDGISLTYLKENNLQASEYGKERLFGAVGWAVASLIIGPFIDKFGFLYVFFWSSNISCILCVGAIIMYMKDNPSSEDKDVKSLDTIENNTSIEDEDSIENGKSNSNSNSNIHNGCQSLVEVEMSNLNDDMNISNDTSSQTYEGTKKYTTQEDNPLMNNTTKDEDEETEMITKKHEEKSRGMMILKSMFHSYTGIGFIISTITLSMGTSIVENLIFLFFDKLGASNTTCGTSVAVTVLFEVPIFQYSTILLQTYGAENLQKVACLAYVIRVVGYTFIPKDHVIFILLLEPLHGVTYACAKSSSVEFASKLSPPGFESTGQGIMSMLQGMGTIFGLSLGGWVEDTFSAVVLYRSYAAVVACGLIIFYITTSIESSSSTTTTRRQGNSSYSKVSPLNDDRKLNSCTIDDECIIREGVKIGTIN